MKIIILASILAAATAASGIYISEEANLIHTEPLTAKSTITKSSQVVDHGSTYIHTPVVHEVHAIPITHEIHSVPVVHSKTTVTKSNQIVNHGGTRIIHAPVHVTEYHAPIKTTITKSDQVISHGGTTVVHAPVQPLYDYVEEYSPIKTTVTKSNQIVNHGGTAVVHAPVVPVHTPVVIKTGDSAVSHQSSTVHETKTAPLYYHSYHY